MLVMGERNDLRETKNIDFWKSLGMASPGVENVGVPWGSILALWGASQLLYKKKSKKWSKKLPIYRPPAAIMLKNQKKN